VLVLNGYYDSATPFSATDDALSHFALPLGVDASIQMQHYEAGHR
jgi:carboxypeptidase C (cathepsin A)